MSASKRPLVLVVLLTWLAAAALFTAGRTLAQGADGVLINYTEVAEEENGQALLLRVFFNLIDSSGKIVGGFEPTEAQLTLTPEDGGGPIPATVELAKGGITLALVLDVSGSMEAQLPRMKTAAQALVDEMPSGTKFTLISFAGRNNITVQTSLDENKDFVKEKIRTLRLAAGTCLYDATFKGVESLIGTTTGRRAVITFTDGRDTITGQDRCSEKTIDEVIAKARDPRFLVPIYTIGLGRAQDVDTEGLIRMAQETRGISSLGTDVGTVFNQIGIALRSQYVAQAVIQPKAGQRDILGLSVTLPGGIVVPRPGTGFFISPKDFTIRPTATITPTSTLPPLTVVVDTVRQDEAAKELIITVTVSDPGQVREYRFDVEDANGFVRQSKVVGAPLPAEVRIPIGDLPAGQYKVRVTAIPSIGQPSRGGEKQIAISQTATPTVPPSETPIPTDTEVPFSMEVTGVKYEDPATRQAILVELRFVAQFKLATLQAKLFDSQKLEVRNYPNLPIQVEVPLDLGDLPGGAYTIEMIALDNAGNFLERESREFTHTPPPTPTFTPSATVTITPSLTVTPTFTATPTDVVPSLLITGLSPDFASGMFIVTLQTQNEQLFAKYQARFINEAAFEVRKEEIAVPPYDVIRLEMAGIEPGEYTLEVAGLAQDGASLIAATYRFKFFPPTATPTLTPTTGNIIQTIVDGVNNPETRPLAVGILAAVGALLLGTIFILTRRPKKPATGTGFLAEMTGAVNIEQMKQLQGQQPAGKLPPGKASATKPAAPSLPAKGRSGPVDDATAATSVDFDKTSPVPHMMSAPIPALVVEDSRDRDTVGKTIKLDHFPFTLGRKGRDLSFDGDDNVSRNHAEIIQRGTQYFIVDNNSTHHTFIDDQQVPPGVQVPLYNGAMIRLGSTTTVRFSTGETTSLDIDKTSPVSY